MIVFNKSKIQKTIKISGIENTFPPGNSSHIESDVLNSFVSSHPDLSIVIKEKEAKQDSPVIIKKEEPKEIRGIPKVANIVDEFETDFSYRDAENHKKKKKKNNRNHNEGVD